MLVTGVVLLLSVPVFGFSVYTAALMLSSLFYRNPKHSDSESSGLPTLTILIATYNDGAVIGETLQSIRLLDYLSDRLQVIVADDSTDDSASMVDGGVEALRKSGLTVSVSRRSDRTGFKAGALNEASRLITGEYVLTLDSDSRIDSASLAYGLRSIQGSDLAFVSFRPGHYNREENVITNAYALFQDVGDGIMRMGASRLGAPFHLSGGQALMRRSALEEVGYWHEGTLAEDADLSCRLHASGFRGKYLAEAEVINEDPTSLLVWKRQGARIHQGWAQVLRKDLGLILKSGKLSPPGKLGLILTLISPYIGLSWIAATLVTAYAIVFGVLDPSASFFTNPVYVGFATLPIVVFYAAGINSLKLRKSLNVKNLALLPVLSYMLSSMFTLSAIAFAEGLAGKPGYFFRTPKKGAWTAAVADSQGGGRRGAVLWEASISLLAVAGSIPCMLRGQYFLGLSLLAFGLATLKSMELSRFVEGGAGKTSPAGG